MKTQKPSELELQVLSVLWEKGPATVHDLLAAMPDGKKRAYTTLLSVVQVMEKKGLVAHDRRGTAHVFYARAKRQQVLTPLLRNLTDHVFGGRPSSVLQFLLRDERVSPAELSEIRKLVREMENPAKQEEGRP
jgi:BlaI family transcriptional regulator, penicillinase repressor